MKMRLQTMQVLHPRESIPENKVASFPEADTIAFTLTSGLHTH